MPHDTQDSLPKPKLEGLNKKSSRGYTRLMIAIENNAIETIEFLLKHDPAEQSLLLDLSKRSLRTPLSQAARFKKPHILKMLLTHLLQLTPLEIHAAYHAKDVEGYTLRDYTTRTGFVRFVKEDKELEDLLTRASLLAPPLWAIESSRKSYMGRQYQQKVHTALKAQFTNNINKPNGRNETPLMEMIESNSIEMVGWILSRPDIDLGVKDEFGINALMQAAFNYANKDEYAHSKDGWSCRYELDSSTKTDEEIFAEKNLEIFMLILKHLQKLPPEKMADIYNESYMKGKFTSIMEYLYPRDKHNRDQDPVYNLLNDIHQRVAEYNRETTLMKRSRSEDEEHHGDHYSSKRRHRG